MEVESGTVKLVSMDGEDFPVDVDVARMSELVENTLGEDHDDEEVAEIPLPKVRTAVLRKVIEFRQHRQKDPMTEIEKPLESAQMSDIVQK